MQVPWPNSYQGAAYLEGFQETARIVANWTEHHL